MTCNTTKARTQFTRHKSNIRMEEESTWGGSRPGAGRKPSAEKRKQVNLRLTEDEEDKVRAFWKNCGLA